MLNEYTVERRLKEVEDRVVLDHLGYGRRLKELEDRLFRAEQQAREALDEVYRLQDRVRSLEYER